MDYSLTKWTYSWSSLLSLACIIAVASFVLDSLLLTLISYDLHATDLLSRFNFMVYHSPPWSLCCNPTSVSSAWTTLPLDLHMVYLLTFFRSLLRCLLIRESIIHKKATLLLNPRHSLFPWSCFTFSMGLITTRQVFVICLLPLDDNLYKERRLYCILSTNSTCCVVVS